MCGVAGIMDLIGQRPIDPARLSRMSDRIAHRGPDGQGQHVEHGLGLAHRRLAIIDLDGGAQPMSNSEQSLRIVFNGEIYNFQELMADLKQRGHHFATRCDTEVILHGYAQWGEAVLDRLRGMFAFALWDGSAGRLLLARDRVGEKPLYYALTSDRQLVFASEVGAVAAALPQKPALDPQAIEDYFALGYVPDPKTIYQGIAKLPPGWQLSAQRGRDSVDLRPYWDVPVSPADGVGAQGEVGVSKADEEALRDRLREATRMRMISDVPLGAFLSGGVDSAGVVAMMAGSSAQPVVTCSIAFDESGFDESRFADQVAERYGTDHHRMTVGIDASSLIDRLAGVYGEPFADSSALPTYLVSGLARRHVTVALTGDGGDESFAGYRRHAFHLREEQVKARLPAGLRRPLFGALASAYPKLDWAPRPLRAKATFEAMASDWVGGYFRAVTLIPTALRQRLYSGDFRRQLGGYEAIEVFRQHQGLLAGADPLTRIQYLDFKTWLPGGMLTKVDRASMAHGLEVRPPLLDHELVAWAMGLPASRKITGMTGKAILKQALEPLLPHDLLYRPKMGFSIPLSDWLRGDLADACQTLATGSTLAATGLFDPATLTRWVSEHRRGARDHGRALWALIMFEAFLRGPAGAAQGAHEPPGLAA